MNKEQFELEPKQISLIYHALTEILTTGQQDQYRGFALSLHTQRRESHLLTSRITDLIEPAIEKLQVSTKSLEEARKVLEFTQWFIKWPNFVGFKGGFRAALGNVRIALRFLPKIGVSEHPVITPLKENKESAEQVYKSSQEHFEQASTEAKNLESNLLQSERLAKKAESDLLNFAEMHAIRSNNTMLRYIRILPQRADELATIYAQSYSADPDRIPNLEGFLRLVSPRKRKRPVPYQHILATEDRPLIDIPHHKLPRAVRNQLHSWVSYQLRLEWTNEGLIEEPTLPDNLRKA